MNWYENKAAEYKTKYLTALEIGEDKMAAEHKIEWDNYLEFIARAK